MKDADMTKIYLITNLLDGKQYVGKTKYSLAHRFSQHCNNAYYNTYIHNAIKKYGKENFKIEELCRCNDNNWQELEKFYIEFYHTYVDDGGYNLTRGGDANPMDDPKIRLYLKQRLFEVNQTERARKTIMAYNNSEARKLQDKRTSIRQKGMYNDNFKRYNEQKSVRVGMVEDDKIIKEFDSVADALRFLNKSTRDAGRLLVYADKFNKNGKRAKFFGYSWVRLK